MFTCPDLSVHLSRFKCSFCYPEPHKELLLEEGPNIYTYMYTMCIQLYIYIYVCVYGRPPSRSAWSVTGWVTISPPKLNSKISKSLAPNFPISEISKISKSPPLCFGKSCPLGRAILEISEISAISEISEILEIRKVRRFQNFQKVRPYVLENPLH